MAGIGAVLLTGYINKVKAGDTEITMPSGSAAFIIKDSVGNQVFRAQSDGNVGIANSAPTKKLDVTGTIQATAFEGDGSALTDITGGGGGKFVDGTDANNAVYISGNVGIGTTGPEGQLHVMVSDASIAPAVVADNLVLEENGAAGMSILSASNTSGSIFFGDSIGNNQRGIVQSAHERDDAPVSNNFVA